MRNDPFPTQSAYAKRVDVKKKGGGLSFVVFRVK